LTIQAVIFDVDGVLLDSEPFILEAAMRYLKGQGIDVKPEDFKPFVGAGEDRFIGGPAEKYGLQLDIERAKDETYAIYGEIVKGRIEPLDGVHDFIATCRRLGLKTALATSADTVKLEINLREIGIPMETFDAAVTGSEVTHKKPDPEIFVKAADHMAVAPAACLVVEDAVNGVTAAKAAGARCLALTTTFAPDDFTDADWIAPTLAEAPKEALEW
jgi:HAD superfamily hydrolase (TIGR01509 family)